MSNKVEEIKLDIEELNKLLGQAQRQKIVNILTLELRRLQTELIKANEVGNEIPAKTVQAHTTNKCYEVKLNNYGWDQTNTVVNLYVTLNNVHELPNELIHCNYTSESVDLRVLGLENKNYSLTINNLCDDIDVEKCYFKVKTHMIVIYLAKKTTGNWSHVTRVEKRIKNTKTTSLKMDDDVNDPGSSLMDFMKKMYQEGDDDMKKTIAKAWSESQDKKAAGLTDFPSL